MQTNVGKTERGASIIAGTLLAYRGLREGGWKGAGLAFLGINFLRRGLLGYCYTYRFLGIDTNHDQKGRNQTIAHGTGIRVDEAITIDRPRHEVYAFWRNPENLAQFMEHVESVRAIDLQSRDREEWFPSARAPTGSLKVPAAAAWNGMPKSSTRSRTN